MMTVKYVELWDDETPQNPKGKLIAMELQNEIGKMEERGLEFVSACFLGEDDVLVEDKDDIFMLSHGVVHGKVKVHKYMLFFK